MIKIENVDIYGWEAAIRGMRNPMNSWSKSDSNFDFPDCFSCPHNGEDTVVSCLPYNCVVLGKNDLKLMKTLSKAGSDHGKFLRMITVTLDITAPLYWWKEFDTYKVGTVANSCSTMHKIHAKEFTLDDFSHEHLYGIDDYPMTLNFNNTELTFKSSPLGCLEITVGLLNHFRQQYLDTKDKKYWWQMIQLLPSSYNQKRTVQLNYQVLKSMYFARKNHKLDEWREFCSWCETLPYFKEVCLDA